MNGHFSSVGEKPTKAHYEHGIQVIDEDKEFNENINAYLRATDVADAGFNYHLISVFGSQSTGKSTLLNYLFGTEFNVMSEVERRQTTKGIWMSKNKRGSMADNILVMDVEGTDGRERGANMGLLKTVFEVNLQLFLKDKQSTPRSLLFFVIRDHIGHTPLSNLRNTLIQDLTKIWSSISKPAGLEGANIEDYFDFAFAALPHKILQPDKFEAEVKNLGGRFVTGSRNSKNQLEHGEQELEGGVFLPEYHRRIPADGFSHYANGIWDQIVHNKDLDLPTQQELLAQFRCDEISREVLVAFDEAITPLEEQQAESARSGRPIVLPDLGKIGSSTREKCVKSFETQASRYHKKVYSDKRTDLEGKIDQRLKTLYHGQLSAAHKTCVTSFSDAVSGAVKQGQKSGGAYEFAEIVDAEKTRTLDIFKKEAQGLFIPGVAWTNFKPQYVLFEKELDEVSSRLRKEEMRRLANRVERWVKSRLSDSVGLEFNKLGSGRGGSGAPEDGEKPPTEKDLWDRIWNLFTSVVKEAEGRFTDRAKSFEASEDEVEIEEEVMEGNILLKLRENFEDKFRYDEAGVPRIWRPADDIEGIYTRARESTLTLIPLLSRFRLSTTYAPPDLLEFIGNQPSAAEPEDEDDLAPIGGIDEEEGKSLEEEMTVLSESKRQDLVVRFKKTADGVYVEAKRSAIGGITQVPLYFYGLLLALGWNEILTVLRNPVLFVLLVIIAGGLYVSYSLNLLGPMMQMSNAAWNQASEIGKQRLREFVENNETARQAIGMAGRDSDSISMDTLDSRGKKKSRVAVDDDDDM
ncbi:Protein sey1 [Daldinia childiae]|uniref:Protein sey1 n=1 Tax=Daldinia childiae TaxID=326645 RepID=UPI0014459756|nr:Protein sey1 [Daldinia childiae]KAF3070709.1 Protein sey1 [Daldinia childiae]